MTPDEQAFDRGRNMYRRGYSRHSLEGEVLQGWLYEEAIACGRVRPGKAAREVTA